MTVERRRAPRVAYRGGVLPPSAEVLPGRSIVVVNLSPTGMLFETAWHIRPGRLVEVRLHFTTSTVVVRADVLRAYVSALDRRRGIRYRAALAFATPIRLPPPADLLDEYRSGEVDRSRVDRGRPLPARV
jgi:hypothetical protein